MMSRNKFSLRVNPELLIEYMFSYMHPISKYDYNVFLTNSEIASGICQYISTISFGRIEYIIISYIRHSVTEIELLDAMHMESFSIAHRNELIVFLNV